MSQSTPYPVLSSYFNYIVWQFFLCISKRTGNVNTNRLNGYVSENDIFPFYFFVLKLYSKVELYYKINIIFCPFIFPTMLGHFPLPDKHSTVQSQ